MLMGDVSMRGACAFERLATSKEKLVRDACAELEAHSKKRQQAGSKRFVGKPQDWTVFLLLPVSGTLLRISISPFAGRRADWRRAGILAAYELSDGPARRLL